MSIKPIFLNTKHLQKYVGIVLLVLTSSLCADSDKATNQGNEQKQLAVAEQMIDAFYSFKPEPLAKSLGHAGESKERILFYQGWAEGGNYIVMKRQACKVIEVKKIECSITVQDDLVLALGIDFDVTDVFQLTFDAEKIISVKTSSNDPQRYHDASKWVKETYPEKINLSCIGTDEQPASAKQCVKDMLTGYKEYTQLKDFTARAPSKK